MAKKNPVLQVLVTSGNQHPLAAGNRVSALKNGQIGVFNPHTGLSVDVTKAGELQEVFIAVGINRTSGGVATMEDLNTSAGQSIKGKLATGYTFKGYTAGKNKIVTVTGFTVDADGAENVLKIEFRNQAIYRESGFTAFSESFVSEKKTVADVVADLVAQVNADPNQLVTATAINAGAGIQLESKPSYEKPFNNDINLRYLGVQGTDIIVSTPAGLEGAVLATTQELAYPEGRGYDVKQLEYLAGGFNGKPGIYRQSDTTGMPRDGYEYFSSLGTNYNLINLDYEGDRIGGGWEGCKQTIIAIPCADTLTLIGDGGTTSNGVIAILDKVFDRFGAMADDAAANGDCTNVATNLLAPATDGVETLS